VTARSSRLIACAGALVLVLAACGSDGDDPAGTGDAHAAIDPPARTAQAAPSCPAAGVSTIDGGRLRMPSGAQPGRTPLLVVTIPGGRGDERDRLGLGRAATRQGIAVLYPTSIHGGFWTLNDEQGTQDVTDVTGLLDRVAPVTGSGCFDPARVSITGVSNGAGFATRMACKLPERFAAVVPVAAGYRALDPCPSAARASFLAIHGTADTVVPFNGKKPDRKGNVPRFTARWARRDGCDATPRQSTPRRLVTRSTYGGCDGARRVELLRLSGTDHGWPGAGPPLPDHNPSGLSATTEVLRFVRGARREAG
jgi:polyhydroxybutyrate depolymerase